jgi:hypothetical protein
MCIDRRNCGVTYFRFLVKQSVFCLRDVKDIRGKEDKVIVHSMIKVLASSLNGVV